MLLSVFSYALTAGTHGGIEVGQQVGGVDFVSGAVAVFGLHHTLYHDLSVGNVLLVEEAVGVVDVGDDGVQLVQVVVEAGRAVVEVLVLVVEAELEVALSLIHIFRVMGEYFCYNPLNTVR